MNASDLLNSISEKKIEQREFLIWLIDNNRTEDVLNMTFCGSWLVFKEYLKTGTATLQKANFCKKFLLCPCCAIRRSSRLIHKYKERVNAAIAENPALIPVMITLTMKNSDDLVECMGRLAKAEKAMKERARKGKSTSGRHTPIEWNKVQGSLSAYEVTHEETGWHPHIHTFALLDAYIDREELSAQWRHYTGNSYIVDVRKCKNEDTGDALVEVLKYSSKFSSMDFEQRLFVYDVIKNKRWVNSAGLLRGDTTANISEPDFEEEEGEYMFRIARWLMKTKSWAIETVDPEELVYCAGEGSAATAIPMVQPF